MRNVLGWALIAFIAWYVIKQPDNAATTGQHLISGLNTAAEAVSKLVGRL